MDSIPLEHCFEDGCQKAVVILTQHKGFVKKPMSPKIAKAMKKYPKVAEGIINRHNMYNQQLEYVEQMEKEGLAYAIRPVLPLDCKTLEKNTAKLESIYQLGYRQGVKIADDVKKFISE
jgi:predicted patatin/cPLA2 family phospholipase